MPKPEIPSGFAAKIGNGFFLTMAGSAMIVITMGCGDPCPVYPGKRYEDWQLEDPSGKDLAAVRLIRDEIDARVEALIRRLAPAS